MSAGQLLRSQYRSFLRILNTFNREGVPLVTLSTISVDSNRLCSHATARAIVRSRQASTPTSANALLARLKHQLDILLHAEDHTREVKILYHIALCKICTARASVTGELLLSKVALLTPVAGFPDVAEHRDEV